MRNLFILTTLSILVFVSCTEEIEMNLTQRKEFTVIEALFTSEFKYQEIKISKTSDYTSEEPVPFSSGANVSVLFENNEITFVEKPNEAGTYISINEFSVQENASYQLNVLHEGELYDATAASLGKIVLDSVSCEHKEDSTFSVKAYFFEPEQKGDRYRWDIYRNGEHITDSLINVPTTTDIQMNGIYANGYVVDEIDAQAGDIIVLVLNSITDEYLNFLRNGKTEASGTNPFFAGTPGNVESNISNGAMGFFATSIIDTKTCIAK